MKVLIVYDSYYGNTQKVAKSIEEKLNDVDVQLIKVDLITQDKVDVSDLVIFGSPTRAFNMTKKVKKALKSLDYKTKKFWVFDTRMDVTEVGSKVLVKLAARFGYAAEKMQSILVKRGAIKAMDYTYYFVKESEGPLYESVMKQVEEDVKALNETIV
ncbi:MAG: flavodoxin family protein [Bacilli bacterium]|nr:flavodoxin family protein [Bacilli bacterium]MBN2877207.1 flavodoxin family protein [Bacilli bacterium]